MITFEETFSHPVSDFEMICGGTYIGMGNFKAVIHVWMEHGDLNWEVQKWTNDDDVTIGKDGACAWLWQALEAMAKNDAKWRESVEVEMNYLVPPSDPHAEHRLGARQLV